MDIILLPLFRILFIVIDLYIWGLIIQAVLSWLIAFRVVNLHSPLVWRVNEFLYKITEPALRPLRKFVPEVSGIDLAPLALILIIWFLEGVLRGIAAKLI